MANYEMFNNPLTVLGAAMMSGFDPNQEGLGGLGIGMLSAGQHVRNQAAIEAEQARAREMADMQRRQYEAQLAQQKARQGQIEQFAGSLPEDQRPMALAFPEILAKQRAESLYQATPTPSAAMKLYSEMGGRQGTGKSFSEWYQEGYKPGGGVTVHTGTQFAPPSKGMVRIQDPSTPTGTRLVQEVGAPQRQVSEAESKNLSIAEENIQLISEVESEMLDSDGNVIPEKQAESRVPGTPLYDKLQTIAQNETYLKSGAAATESETEVMKAGIQPSFLDIGKSIIGMESTADEKLERSKAYAQSRAGTGIRRAQPGATSGGWKLIRVD